MVCSQNSASIEPRSSRFKFGTQVWRRLPPRVTLECRIFYYSSLPSVLVSRSCGSLSHWSTAIPLFGLVCRAMQREGSTSCFRSPSCASWARSRGNPAAALSAVAACCFPFVQQGNEISFYCVRKQVFACAHRRLGTSHGRSLVFVLVAIDSNLRAVQSCCVSRYEFIFMSL